MTAPDLGQPLPRPQALEQLRGVGEGGVRQLAQAEHLPHRHAEAPHVGLGAVHLHSDGRRRLQGEHYYSTVSTTYYLF